jgi:alkanesulfonate monooxygenase SsuD/methylene tetrahydromethanopterin reductase-like flavin-dependent oxidoreductase (luciferase family)
MRRVSVLPEAARFGSVSTAPYSLLRQTWTEDNVNYADDFYPIRDFTLKPEPLNAPQLPNPDLFQGDNSTAARRNGGRHATGTSPTARVSTVSQSNCLELEAQEQPVAVAS